MFGSLYRALRSRKNIKISTKVRLKKSVVLATLLYGTETWVPSTPQIKRLQAFVMWCLCVILGVTRWEKKRNTEVWLLEDDERVEMVLMRRRLCWLSHLE